MMYQKSYYDEREKNDALRAKVDALREALEHISEYWNRSENDTAMNDALYHMIDTADAALRTLPPPLQRGDERRREEQDDGINRG
jgi:hypothetical protein